MTKNDKKKQKLRNAEYYDIQEIFDNLYQESKNGRYFKNLVDVICSTENILLAYRNIKKNKGSKTPGTNKNNIDNLGTLTSNELVKHVREKFKCYKPETVRRVLIPKQNGTGTRPLGIPTIEDRLIQQCILQILEPICEAKFYEHSYGFRPNRSTHHAMARAYRLMNRSKLHYVVEFDIKGFFDNVNHGKLLKQLWSIGIQDKKLISIISTMLKAEVDGEGIQTKGTPQGGILSPLLSNIVLNEMDWWISSQWHTMITKKNYDTEKVKANDEVEIVKSHTYRALKTTNLKEAFLVRYADDFRIFCRNYEDAQKLMIAVRKWLKERLGLELNMKKTRVVNLRKNYSEFLGFKMKVIKRNNKYVVKSHINSNNVKKIKKTIKMKVKQIQNTNTIESVNHYNSTVLGYHNYYKIATMVNTDLYKIAFLVSKTIHNRLKNKSSFKGTRTKSYEKFYGTYNFKTYYVKDIPMFPLNGIKTQPPINFSQEINNYTIKGRAMIHANLQNVDYEIIHYLMRNPVRDKSNEYNDNRLAVYIAQKGLCKITKEKLEIGRMECHHIKPIQLGGTDKYSNLMFVKDDIHKLIHSTNKETIKKYLELNKFMKNFIEILSEINKLRNKAKLETISLVQI